MLDFERTCRTCMKTNSAVGLINLFGPLKIEDNCSLKLADLLKETITLEIDEDDGLPQNVCNECLKSLQIMYTFRTQALNSENELKKIASACTTIKNETELDVKYESDHDYMHSYDDFIYDDTHRTKVESDDLSMYICNICNKKFTKRKRFLKHLSNHENPKFPCQLCKKTFQKESSLQRHLNKRHNEHLSESDVTNSLLNNAGRDLGVKVEIESINEHYQCSECGIMFNDQQSMLLHFKEHTHFNIDLDKHVYSCMKCLISYPTQQQLTKHNLENHNIDKKDNELLLIGSDKKHECPECHVVFEKQRSLASHLKKHKVRTKVKTESAYYCGHCDKAFGLKTLLRRHMKLHFNDRPFRCTKCSNSYTRQDQLVVHLSKHNGSKKYTCSHCEKAFTQLCSLKDHERTHTGETPFLCSQCGKGFSNSSNLRQHLKRHSGVKPFSCNLCPKTFCTKGQMKSHIDTHAGVHPYKCDVCGASFTKPNSLKKHSLIHLGIKPFACDNCAMRFSSKDHLKRHKRIHTGEKPYRCQHCPRAFSQSNDLVKHVRAHLGQNIYQCTVCQAKFRLMRELKRHYPVHYIDGVETNPMPEIEAPLVILKECSDQDMDNNVPTDGQITITFNSNVLDKNSIGDITINIEPGKISN